MNLLRRGIIQSLGAKEDMNIIEFFDGSIDSGSTKDVALSQVVDLDKSAIIFFGSHSTGGANISLARAEFLDDSTVRLTRGSSTATETFYQFYVVDFPDSLSVNYYDADVSSLSQTQAITSVNSGGGRSFILSSASNTDALNTINDRVECFCEFASDTLVTVSRQGAFGVSTCGFFVIELPPL
tara:strand:- start:60 stop:608 length:549 start_codon:yes stop_codon:yes gene_type:complete